MNQAEIKARLQDAFPGIEDAEAKGKKVYHGKVRDVVDLGDRLLIVATDRISAFDRILSTIPFKGEVLNQIARFWFDKTADIIPNHIVPDAELGQPLSKKTGRAIVAKKADMLPVEVIVRGYLTGSAWRDYQSGKSVSGIALKPGLRFNERFATPLITPSTKESEGHDQPISGEEIVRRGLVKADIWKQVEEKALALFARGQEIAAKNGLILVDTKYEFGLVDGKLIICDEIHTPDSSRYWYKDSYEELFAKGEKQRELDKEYFRRWLMERGFQGDGEAPEITEQIRVEVAERYITAFETVTGQKFAPNPESVEAEKAFLLSLLS
jgi:phosphoribosylaminoimidazole-succinocarboxamide synthase